MQQTSSSCNKAFSIGNHQENIPLKVYFKFLFYLSTSLVWDNSIHTYIVKTQEKVLYELVAYLLPHCIGLHTLNFVKNL